MNPVLQDDRITSIGLLFEATSAVRAAIERRGGLPNNHEVLLRLARSPGQRLRMTDLAAQAGLTPSGVSRAVDRLIEEGLVERAVCKEDARGQWAQLTPKGTKLMIASLKKHVEDVQELFIDVLSAEQRQQLESICRTLRDALNPCATAGIEDA